MIPWRSFKIHGTFPLHQRFFIEDKCSSVFFFYIYISIFFTQWKIIARFNGEPKMVLQVHHYKPSPFGIFIFKKVQWKLVGSKTTLESIDFHCMNNKKNNLFVTQNKSKSYRFETTEICVHFHFWINNPFSQFNFAFPMEQASLNSKGRI